MQIFESQEIENNEQIIRDVFENGGLIIYPTETFYGIGANPFNEEALKKIFSAKEREQTKPIPLIAANENIVESICTVTEFDEKLIRNFWPGPLTLILKVKRRFPEKIAKSGKVAIRVSSNPIATKVARICGGLITSTSCNTSNEPPTRSIQEIPERIKNLTDIIIDNIYPLSQDKPSTIVEIYQGRINIIREGVIRGEDVKKILKLK